MYEKLTSLLVTIGILLLIPVIWASLAAEQIAQLDTVITTTIYNSINSPTAVDIFTFITTFTIGNWPGVLMAIGFFIWKKRYLALAIYSIGAIIITFGVKLLQEQLARPRPFLTVKDITALTTGVSNDFGFPSGHTTMAFFVAYYITNAIEMKWQLKLALYILAALVAFSRIYLGVHYFLDTIAGVILGIAVARIAMLFTPAKSFKTVA